jgi:hypothetical protein
MVPFLIHLIWTLVSRRVRIWGLFFLYYMPPNCSILLTITRQIHMVLLMTLSCMRPSNLTIPMRSMWSDIGNGKLCQRSAEMDIQDKLKLNDGKTELLIIGSKQQLQKLNPCHVRACRECWCPSCTNSSWSRSLTRFKFINVMSCIILASQHQTHQQVFISEKSVDCYICRLHGLL